MSSVFQPPPTWAPMVIVNPGSKEQIFNPIWLKWFIELSKNFDVVGAATGSVTDTQTLQLTGVVTGGPTLLTDGTILTALTAGSVLESNLSLSDNTTGNVTTAKHGFTPKLSGVSTEFLNGSGSYAVPALGSIVESNISLSDITTNNVTTAKHGFVPKLSGVATQFFTGAGTYASLPARYLSQTFTGQTSVNVTHNFGIYPLVQVIDSNGFTLSPTRATMMLVASYLVSIVHNTVNDFTLTFTAATTGTVITVAGTV